MAAASVFPVAAQTTASTKTYAFTNGQWFDGKTFKKKTFYSQNGLLTTKKPAQIDETVDMKNGYVVPPFADVHTHNLDGPFNIDAQVAAYLKDGIFYAKVQTNVRTRAAQVAQKVNIPTSVDVSYAHGGLTASYGHGVEVYEGLALYYRTGGFNAEETQKVRNSKKLENDAYYIIDTAEDLEKKWPMIVANKPDFIKIYLLTTEEFEERKARTDTVGDRGLDPKLVPAIVAKAHAAELKVSAHVDTMTDYRVAINAGVDELAHMPGYYVQKDSEIASQMLTEEDVKETVKRKVWVDVSPVAYNNLIAGHKDYDAPLTERTNKVRVHNLKLLKKHGARMAFGSDRYNSTPLDDVLYIQKLGVFSNLEVLKIWAEQTPLNIFPARKIGYLKGGYEASFLVLGGDPLTDFEQVKNITMRVKQGTILR